MGFFTSPKLKLRTPEAGNAPTLTADLKSLAAEVDAALKGFVSYGVIQQRVAGEANIEAGSGDFTAIRVKEGEYKVTWNVEKSAELYAVTVGCNPSGGSIFTPVVTGIGKKSFTVQLYNQSKELKDTLFMFIVVAAS